MFLSEWVSIDSDCLATAFSNLKVPSSVFMTVSTAETVNCIFDAVKKSAMKSILPINTSFAALMEL